MAVTYGFYDAQMINQGTKIVPDRAYNAEQLSSIFDGIISDGVYSTVGDGLLVSPNGAMQIKVGKGRAWFNHTWTLNDSDLPLDVTAAENVRDRIDTVVIKIDKSNAGRINTIEIIDGEPSSTPVARTYPVHGGDLHVYPLADIYVKAGTTAITQDMITNRIGTNDTPLVTGLLQQLSLSQLLSQWDAQFKMWTVAEQADFAQWFNGLQIILDGDVATNLANEIEIDPTTIALYESMGWTDPGVTT